MPIPLMRGEDIVYSPNKYRENKPRVLKGVGLDLSNLRPRGAKVNNSAKTTSGAVSFMKTFDVVTETICQNGRRGALMLSIDINHPDVEEFIDIKANTDMITNANISVRVNDEFMKSVNSNYDYVLTYPCNYKINIQDIDDKCEYGKLMTNYDKDGNIVCYYKLVKARDLFDKLVKNNWNYAEPGILFWDRIESYNMMSKNPEFKYAGVNPCARLSC